MAVTSSTSFEATARPLLTSTVKVVAANRRPSKAGGVIEPGAAVISDLLMSVQSRLSLDERTVLGHMPDMTHMGYCRGEDADAVPLDIHKQDKVLETNGQRRRFVILTEPQAFPDLITGGTHHLEMELSEDIHGLDTENYG
jgi:hypothetical protein